MTISPVFHGAPDDCRVAVEQQTYQLLQRLGIEFDRVDHDEAATMEDCAAISAVMSSTPLSR